MVNTTVEANGKQKRDVYLTGFGKFGNILENPTTLIVQKLADDENVTEAVVLETSTKGALEMLALLRKKAEERGRPCIFLHLGVNAGSTEFALESAGYNLADFRIPDERGYIADREIIDEAEEASLTTAVPLEKLLSALQVTNPAVTISTDPGRYICNYVYFHSLQWVKEQAGKDNNDVYGLFVHVPQFSVIPFEDQVEFVRKLLEVVSTL